MLYVILDGGHGWETKGKQSNDGSLKENEFNDFMVASLSSLLEYNSIPYFILSMDHQDTPLATRSLVQRRIASEIRKMGYEPLTISIHADWFYDPLASGGFIAYISDKSEEIAHFFTEYMREGGIKMKEPRRENFHMLRETSGRALLFEMGMMSNEGDLKLLKDPIWRNRASKIILNALIAYEDIWIN